MPTGSLNISHPLVFSASFGQVTAPFVYDVEFGFGGSKVGFGLGALEQSGGRGGGIALKAVLMRTWKSPVDSPWEDEDFVADNPFLEDQNYIGVEGVLSPLPMRLAIGAYRLIGDAEGNPEFDKEDDFVFGMAIGLGF